MLAGETHGAHAAACEEQFLSLGEGIAEAAVAAGANDGGMIRGGFRWCRLHTRVCMLLMLTIALIP